MLRLLRILRGTLGMALTWAVPWAIAGAILRVLVPFEPGPWPSITMLVSSAIHLGTTGAIAGGAFALLIGARGAEQFTRRSALSVVALGIVSALFVPLETFVVEVIVGPVSPMWLWIRPIITYSVLGGASAYGVWRMAKQSANSMRSTEAQLQSGDQGQWDRESSTARDPLRTAVEQLVTTGPQCWFSGLLYLRATVRAFLWQ